MVPASLVERLKRWPRPRTHEEKVEQAIDRLMLVEAWLFWYINELEDLKLQLSADPALRLLVPIVEVMIAQLWQLMRRWIAVKAEVIREARKGLMKKKKKIEGDGFTIEVLYSKYVIDIRITLHGGHGGNARIPNLGIPEAVLRAMRLGWRASDSSQNYDYPAMGTHFTWQALSWLILHPGAEVSIYAEGISIGLDGIKPRWELYVNGFNVEWPDDIKAYQEMAGLPRELLVVSLLHSIFGDGSGKASGGRKITLYNSNRGVLELIAERLKSEFKINKPVSPGKGVWRYEVSGENAKTLTEVAVKATRELASAVGRLYDLMASERYELTRFSKWAKIVRASIYVHGKSKIEFTGIAWSPRFTNGAIDLMIQTKDVGYAEELRRRLKSKGITVAITKYTHKRKNITLYKVIISWSELKKYLCGLREQLIEVAQKAKENCQLWNLLHPDKRKNCNEIPAVRWLQRLTDPQWLRENIGCSEA